MSLTASGGGTGSIDDTDLANYTEDDGGIQGWVQITGTTDDGAPLGDVRSIKNGTAGYTASSTRITVNQNFSAGMAANDTFRVHRFDPVAKQAALVRAIETSYPLLYLPIRDQSVMIDNRLLNSDFETFANSLFTSWASVGSPTLTQESTIIRQLGQKSAKVVASGADGQLTQAPHMSLNEMTGKTARAHFWAYATAASKVRVRLDWDGTNFENSDYHSGKDQWELLKAEGTVPDAATQIKTICEVVDGSTGYFARGYQAIGRVWRYTVPSTIIEGPHSVEQQDNGLEPDGDYVALRTPIEGRILQMRGMGRLTAPTTDTGTVEVDGPRADLIVAKAAEILFGGMVQGDPGNFRHDPAYWRGVRMELEDQPGIRMAPMGSRKANGYYRPEEDASGRYIRILTSR